MNTGRLVVFEGSNGVGKSSLAGAILDELKRNGEPVELWSFPGKEPGTVAEWIYRLYHDPAQFHVPPASPEALQTLVTAAHIEVINARVQPSLAAGRIVLLDRYWWSTWVYATLEGVRAEFRDSLIELELQTWGSARPDVVFLITGPSRKTVQRPMTDGEHVNALYKDLISCRPYEYPVQIISNNGEFNDAVTEIKSVMQKLGIGV